MADSFLRQFSDQKNESDDVQFQMHAVMTELAVMNITAEELCRKYPHNEDMNTSDPVYNLLLKSQRALMDMNMAWIDYIKHMGELAKLEREGELKIPISAHATMIHMPTLSHWMVALVHSMTAMRRVAFPTLSAFQEFKRRNRGFLLVCHHTQKFKSPEDQEDEEDKKDEEDKENKEEEEEEYKLQEVD